MKILIQITADRLLLCHEALSLAFALAAFDHEIQLQLGDAFVALLLQEPTGKLANMLSSLALYDLPPAWVAPQHLSPLNNLPLTQDQTPALTWPQQVTVWPDDKAIAAAKFDTVFVL